MLQTARTVRKDIRLATRSVTVLFDGKPLACRHGASVAVALWEQGIRVLSHSPKYGRPRGLFCARGHCTSCLLRIDGVPNVRSCLTPVRDGMRIERQDSGAPQGPLLQKMLETGDNVFPVGFYYKWFTRPPALARFFLRQLRPLTGIGRLPEPGQWGNGPRNLEASEPAGLSPAATAVEHIVVGAGISGLRAAGFAQERVWLVDDHPVPGGQRWAGLELVTRSLGRAGERFPVLQQAHRALCEARDAVLASPSITFTGNSRIVAAYRPDQLLLQQPDGLTALRIRSLTWCAGALDSLGLFPGNDLPGLFGPRALYRLLTRDELQVQERSCVVIGSGLDFWLTAVMLSSRGAEVELVLDEPGWDAEVATARQLGWRLHTGLRLGSARRQRNGQLVLHWQGDGGRRSFLELTCDLAVLARPGKPVYDIPYQLGADLRLEPTCSGFLPPGLSGGRFSGRLPAGVDLHLAGEAAGLSPVATLAVAPGEASS
jgi:sarcosine oxidase subunit alpha